MPAVLVDHTPLLRPIQSVLSAAPKLQLHLFKSSSNQLFFSSPAEPGKPINEHSLAKYWNWIDEVGRHSCNKKLLCNDVRSI